MRRELWIVAAMLINVACVTEGPTSPSKVPPKDPQLTTVTVDVADAETNNTGGGKACVLTPADPTLIPVGIYTCPNGVVFTQACPSTGCSRVAPQPKKN